jgi:hypothetical protein
MKRTKRTAAAILAALIASASLSSCFTFHVLQPRPKAEKKIVTGSTSGKKSVLKKKNIIKNKGPRPKGDLGN